MIKTILTTIVVCLLILGCEETNLRKANEVTTLGQKEFGTTEYWGMKDVFQTDSTSWLMTLDTTEVIGGKVSELKPGMYIMYDAYNFDWISDNMGFNHFCYFADRITILSK